MGESLVVVGDALLDRDLDGRADRLAPDAPVPVVHDAMVHARPGGAGLAALLAARRGARVTLVTALGDDEAGAELAALLDDAGVEVIALRRPATPVKTRVRVDGHPVVRLDDGTDDGDLRAVDRADDVFAGHPVLVADYGLGVATHPRIRDQLELAAAARPLVWDPHPRGDVPVRGAVLATPNRAEAHHHGHAVESIAAASNAAVALAAQWGVRGVALTLGARGAVVGIPGRLPFAVPAPTVVAGDACGAGDCFSVGAALALAAGRVLTEAVTAAVADATTFVAEGGVGALHAEPEGRHDAPDGRLDAVRRRGGVVVATCGCFDLLHAGHVSMLRAARALGDALVVLLNSDRSVQDLKGADRPIVPQADRAAVLRGLECVDAVEVFDESTPVAALERLRPQLFVKGDDYGAGSIPEAAVMQRWGGAVVVVPYLEGRSTSGLIAEVQRDS
jgi:D-beta-D-heptose 7-phosphate kinase/D-beta-D-heptose 1-phosphate adenosyltransferase